MSSADVFVMDPDEVHNAIEVLFDVEATVDSETTALCDETDTAAAALKESGTALGQALDAASGWWKLNRAGGFSGLVGSSGEYLAVCTEEAMEIDEYNAADFAHYADHDRYPGRANETASERPDW